LLYLALFTLLLHFLTNNRYGYHRDELYFIACGEHLAWGYVDHAPLVPFVARVSRAIFGDSLFGLRFFPALAGALLVFFTGLLARQLGGGRFAQVLAALSALVAPVYLRAANMLCIPIFEQLLWVLCCYLVVLLIKEDNPKLWLLVGLIIGIGTLAKHSVFFFAFGLLAGLLLTRQRRFFLSGWLWAGILIACVIFLPNLLWQINNGWPTLEFLRDLNRTTMRRITLMEFLAGQALYLHPLSFVIAVAGLCYYVFTKEGGRYRLLAWNYIAVLALLIAAKSKIYYLAPAYPALLAAGALVIERATTPLRRPWLRPAAALLLIAGGIVTAPVALPLLPLGKVEAYARLMTGGLFKNVHEITGDYRDMVGWENLVGTVANVYRSLPPEERSDCAIFAQNYGEAGAIDFFGRRWGLPKAISGHNSYYLWGPRGYSGKLIIAVGVPEEELKPLFAQVTLAEVIRHEHALENNVPVRICRGLRLPLRQGWPQTKSFN